LLTLIFNIWFDIIILFYLFRNVFFLSSARPGSVHNYANHAKYANSHLKQLCKSNTRGSGQRGVHWTLKKKKGQKQLLALWKQRKNVRTMYNQLLKNTCVATHCQTEGQPRLAIYQLSRSILTDHQRLPIQWVMSRLRSTNYSHSYMKYYDIINSLLAFSLILLIDLCLFVCLFDSGYYNIIYCDIYLIIWCINSEYSIILYYDIINSFLAFSLILLIDLCLFVCLFVSGYYNIIYCDKYLTIWCITALLILFYLFLLFVVLIRGIQLFHITIIWILFQIFFFDFNFFVVFIRAWSL